MTNNQTDNLETIKSDDTVTKDSVVVNTSMKNYLDSKILKVKSYNSDEISKIDKNTDFSISSNLEPDIYSKNVSELSEKQLVKGTVVSLNNKEVLVDIGFKSEGTINLSEFDVIPAIGQEIDVFLVVFEDRHGRLILSKEKAEFEKKWMTLRNAFADESIIKGLIVKRIKGGMVVDLSGINAFLPGSQIDSKPVSDFDSYLNQEFEFKIVKFNELRQNIVVSRKAIMSDHSDINKKEIFDSIEKGMEIDGLVKNITDFGAFVDLGSGVDGLLHITDITWGRINHPSDRLSIGDKIKVKIIDIDNEKNRLSLGTKQLSPNPWESINSKYSVDNKIEGKIVNIMNYGIFIELEEGIEGLVHISEFSWTKHINHPSDIYKVGDKIKTSILSIDQENKKISLGIKQLLKNPWLDVEDKFKVDDIYDGVVTTITQSGLYVCLSDEIEGFVANDDISWTRKIKSASNIFKKNDKVKVKVTDVISVEKKLSLSIKKLIDDPWLNINTFFTEKTLVKGTVLFNMDKGVVVLLDNEFEGIIPASKINGSVTDYQMNDMLTLNIEEINIENRRIVLSIDESKVEKLDSQNKQSDDTTIDQDSDK